MWDPALPSGCQPASSGQSISVPSACQQSIPVPLGYMTLSLEGWKQMSAFIEGPFRETVRMVPMEQQGKH